MKLLSIILASLLLGAVVPISAQVHIIDMSTTVSPNAAIAKKALGMTPDPTVRLSNLSPTAAAALTSPTAAKGPIPPPRETLAGTRTTVGAGTLFVPDFYTIEPDGNITLVLFFHGASWCAEQGFVHAHRNAVLVTVNAKNYGYPQLLKDPKILDEIVHGVEGVVGRLGKSTGTVRRIVVSSFSGGWTGVDGVLRDARYAPLVTDVLLADSLYPRRANRNEIDPEMLAPIADFAMRAAADPGTTKPATMAFTYLFPPKIEHRNNTTCRAADELARLTGARWTPTDGKSTRGMKYGRRADLNNLHLIGVEGMTTQDHFEHFYSWEDLLCLSSLQPAMPAPTTEKK